MVPNTSHVPTDESQRYVTYYDRNGTAHLSTVIVHALADLMNADTDEGEQALYESVDPESLDHLFKPTSHGTARTGGHLTFLVNGYLVMVHGAGRIEITPRQVLDHEGTYTR